MSELDSFLFGIDVTLFFALTSFAFCLFFTLSFRSATFAFEKLNFYGPFFDGWFDYNIIHLDMIEV